MSRVNSRKSTATWYRWALLAAVWLLYAAFGLVVTSLAPLIPLIEADLKLSHAAMGSIMGAWQLVYIFSAIPCGLMLDKLGSRWSLTIGGLLMAASIFARGTAENYTELLLAVMLFGLGGPIISAGAPKVITQWFAGTSRGLAMGIYMTGPAVGGIISLTMTHSVLLPAFSQSWREVMTIWALICIVASLAWLGISSVPASNATPTSKNNTPTLPQGQVLKKFLGEPAVLLVLGMSVGVFFFNHGLNNWLPELLRSGGMTLLEAGYWAAIPTLIGLIGSLLIPRLATPQRRFQILIALSLIAASASIMLQFQSEPLLFTGLLMQGIARSSLMTILVLTLIELPGVGERYVGVATGLFFSAAEIGGVLGPLSIGILYDLTNSFDTGLLLLTGIALLLAMAAYKLKKRVSDGF